MNGRIGGRWGWPRCYIIRAEKELSSGEKQDLRGNKVGLQGWAPILRSSFQCLTSVLPAAELAFSTCSSCILESHAGHNVKGSARVLVKAESLSPWPAKPPQCPVPTANHLIAPQSLAWPRDQAVGSGSSWLFRQSSFHKFIYYSFPTSPPLPHQLLKIFFKQKNPTTAGNQP